MIVGLPIRLLITWLTPKGKPQTSTTQKKQFHPAKPVKAKEHLIIETMRSNMS
jgi:hypothetical protein